MIVNESCICSRSLQGQKVGVTEVLIWKKFKRENEGKILERISLTLIGKSWKTHSEFFLEFSFSGSSHRPFYWKTHPFKFLTETIYDT